MNRRYKLDNTGEVEVGSVVKYKNTDRKTRVAEVSLIYGATDRLKYEVIKYDMRLKPMIRADGSYVRKTIPAKRCKLIDGEFKFDTGVCFELGDVVCRHTNTTRRYGVIVGFVHPDGLITTSYENGYNGTDLIECVEISKRGLESKRDKNNKIKRFRSTSNRLKMCEVDLWNKTGPKIVSK